MKYRSGVLYRAFAVIGFVCLMLTLFQCSFTVTLPRFVPPGGNYETAVTVTITCDDETAVIWYTIDGSDPGTSETAVQGAELTISEDTVLKAVARTVTPLGESQSAVATASYTIGTADDGTGDDGTSGDESGPIEILGGGTLPDPDDPTNTVGFYLQGAIDVLGNLTGPDGTGDAILTTIDDVDGVWVRDAAWSGDTVVVVGEYRLDPLTFSSQACIWEDGVRTDLPNQAVGASYVSSATSVAIGSIHVGGYQVEDLGAPTYEQIWEACYWSDGTLNLLQEFPAGASDSTVADIAYVPGGSLFLAGEYSGDTVGYNACVWEVDSLGTESRLDLSVPTTATAARAGSVAVANGVVYVAGTHSAAMTTTVCTWADGVRTDLATAEVAWPNAIAIDDGDLFVAGWTASLDAGWLVDQRAHVWINETQVDLSTEESGAADVAVVGDRLLVSGFDTVGGVAQGAIWVIEIPAAEAATVQPKRVGSWEEFAEVLAKILIDDISDSELSSLMTRRATGL